MARPKSTKEQKKLADDARLLRAWKAFHREEREAVLAGPYASTLSELFRAFSAIEHVTPVQLVGLVAAIDWSSINANPRLVTLHELNAAITKYREKCGLPPIDDALPGEQPRAFQAIKAIINQFPAPAGERRNPETATQTGSTVRLCHE